MTNVIKISAKPRNSTKETRVAAYCRVSTNTLQQSQSLANQEAHYRSLIAGHHGWKLVNIFHDVGISGTKLKKRTGLHQLLVACEHNQVDLVVTKSISRLARNTTDSLHIVRRLNELNIPIIFERENINTSSMDGEMMLAVLSSLAQDESLSISKNIKVGIRQRASNGTYHYSTPPYGYKKQGQELVIDPEKSKTIRQIFNWAQSGKSADWIASELNVRGLKPQRGKKWYESTIRQMLKNPTFTGTLVLGQTQTDDQFNRHHNPDEQGWHTITNHHPAIIDQKTFKAVNEQLAARSQLRKAADYHRSYPFTGIITCAGCGCKMKRHTANGLVYWGCKRHLQDSRACPVKSIREDQIKRAWVTMYNKLNFSWRFLLTPFIDDLKVQIAEKEGKSEEADQLQGYQKKLKTLAALFEQGVIDNEFYQHQQQQIHDQITRIQIGGDRPSKSAIKLQAAKQLRKSFQDEPVMLNHFNLRKFYQTVTALTVDPRRAITFHLKCGLNLKEQVIKNG